MDADRLRSYCERIGVEVPRAPSVQALHEIQLQHVLNVPFENLDIIAGRMPLKLDADSLFDKIVVRRRGGICYELNLLLADALEAMGYDVMCLSGVHPKYGDLFDHALLLVTVTDESAGFTRWIVDVGFADNFRVPLPFRVGEWASDGRDTYQLRVVEGISAPHVVELMRKRGGEEALMYSFALMGRSVAEYQPRADWYAAAVESRFTQGPLVCMEHEGGRVSLTMNRVLNTYNGQRVREDIASFEDFEQCLRDVFGMELDDDLRDALARPAK